MRFEEIDAPTPSHDDVAAEVREIETAMRAARDVESLALAVGRWDELRRRLATWTSLTNLRFSQDTTNEEYRAAREHLDELRPKLTELAVGTKRLLVESDLRPQLEERFGPQAFALWEADITSFDPAIEDELVREAKLEANYTELMASARIELREETYTLSEITKFREHPDRELRHEAEQARWAWFGDNAEALDRLYDQLVEVRTDMGRELGHGDYIPLGYQRMYRVDYGRADVERYREAVREHVVPLAATLREAQKERLGIDELMYWDSAIQDPEGNPTPKGDHDWMLARAQEMFDALGGELPGFFRQMVEGGFLDLKARDGKAGGGFCTSFPTHGMPYVFANFNGTKGDVEVFTHEMGHAFQNWMSRELPLMDYHWPSMESCEIHSMSLEFLTWPHMEKFFEEDAERFRRIHLVQSLLFLPYGVAVDHYQHEVYARPDMSPAERLETWRAMEQTYLPWRRYGDLDRPASGGMWQAQSHIYTSPFYYIDYTLAQVCALQFWMRSRRDFTDTMGSYMALCRRGGEVPFQQLVSSADLVSPFTKDCLPQVLSEVRKELVA